MYIIYGIISTIAKYLMIYGVNVFQWLPIQFDFIVLKQLLLVITDKINIIIIDL